MLGGSTNTVSGALQTNASSTPSYGNERSTNSNVEVEIASDPASGGFFQTDYKK